MCKVTLTLSALPGAASYRLDTDAFPKLWKHASSTRIVNIHEISKISE